MKAPDKIYFDGTSSACKQPLFSSQNIEYIRKDTLLEWAKDRLEFAKALGSQGQIIVCEELINKLESM